VRKCRPSRTFAILSEIEEHPMANDPEQIIRDFCAAFANLDPNEVMGYFGSDHTYHNMPGPPAVGEAAVRATVEGFLGR
jgi:limonene-1,2-epoxide hydrolase